jgi:hypothetical protein
MNEDELENLVDIPTCVEHGESRFPTLGNVAAALKKLRTFQKEATDRVYVTLGANGGIVLDEDDNLFFCDVIDDLSRRPVGKTAIGDTYATFLLALETIGNYIRPYNIPPHDVGRAAAAGADSGVYDGFGNLAVNKVNNFLGERKRRVVCLGRLATFPHSQWSAAVPSSMRGSDWEAITRWNCNEPGENCSFVTSTLQEVIGRAFLRV